MKRLLFAGLIVMVAAGCKKTPSAPPANASAPGAPAAAPPGVPAMPKPLPAQMPDVIARVNGDKVERWELETAIKGVEVVVGSHRPDEEMTRHAHAL